MTDHKIWVWTVKITPKFENYDLTKMVLLAFRVLKRNWWGGGGRDVEGKSSNRGLWQLLLFLSQSSFRSPIFAHLSVCVCVKYIKQAVLSPRLLTCYLRGLIVCLISASSEAEPKWAVATEILHLFAQNSLSVSVAWAIVKLLRQ